MASLPDLIDELRRSDLVDADDLEAVLADEPADRLALLDGLVGRGALTPFQAREVNAGHTSRLRLGNYVVSDRLGEGAMGVVFKARHRVMDRVVAVKVIKAEAIEQHAEKAEQFVVRFAREVKAAARLNHPNVVAAYDADECELGLFLVMEFVEGVDLETVLERGGPMPWAEAAEAIRQAAVGMEYAHSQTLVHRDLKPANLMRDLSGTVKIADLGLARTDATEAAERAESDAEGATMAGTVDYMPPEQAVDTSRVDHRADIYSLGATLFTLLADRPMFVGENMLARLMAHRTQPRPSLLDLPGRPDAVPPELDAIYRQMCQPMPDDRFQSMEAVAEALKDLLKSEGADRRTDWDPQDTTVLVVEASRLQGRIIGRQLAEIGFDDIHFAADGEAALEQFEKMPGELILTSMQLPDMTGLELAERLRGEKRWATAGVLVLHSTDLPPTTQKALGRLPAVATLAKPFETADLDAAVDRLMRTDRTADDLIGFAGRPVLVADDSRVWRRRMTTVLQEVGFDTLTVVEDGQQAIDAAAATRFDLVVTDYNMPHATGHDLLAYLRRQSSQPDVPVVMVTTELDPAKLGAVYQLGVSAVCNKTFEPAMVKNILTRIFL